MIFSRVISVVVLLSGVALALFGLLLDSILLDSQPGFSLPQLLIVAVGVGLAGFGWRLRRDRLRKRLARQLRANLGKAMLVALVTMVALELVLTLVGYSTYYPVELPVPNREIIDWFICDAQMGCRYQHEAARGACEAGELIGLHCVFNSLGFADSDEFVASADLAERHRVLVLGDSFSHGYSADVGFSYVATIEKALPEIVLWNLGIAGTGTNQALASFRGIAPIMQPHLTILGFYVGNDFVDNRLAIEKTIAHSRLDGGVRTMDLVFEGRWGALYEVEPETMMRYRRSNVNPPPNELERIIGLTRLGSILLRSMDALCPLFDGVRFAAQVEVTSDLLQALQAETDAMDSQLLVLVIPEKEDFSTKTDKYTTAIDLMRQSSIPYLEVINSLQVMDDYSDIDWHWNNSGHRVVGDILAECIEAFFAAGSLSACDRVVLP